MERQDGEENPSDDKERSFIFLKKKEIEANYKQIKDDKSSHLEIDIDIFSCCLMEYKSPTFNSFEKCFKIFFLSLITVFLPLYVKGKI